MATEKTTEALRRIRKACESGGPLCPDRFEKGLRPFLDMLREVEIEANNLDYILSEITDRHERQIGVREVENKIQGLKDRITRARAKVRRIESTITEIPAELPRIAKTLGVELPEEA